MDCTSLDSRLGQIDSLPALPEVATSLITMLGDPDTSILKIKDTMEKDPALVASILRTVNSAYYGVGKKVSTLRVALALLGFRTIKSIVLAASVDGIFKKKTRTQVLNNHAFASQSVASAAICRHLAIITDKADPEEAFSVGLLHNIGKLALDQCFPEEFTLAVELAREKSIAPYQAERETIGTDHAYAGRILAEHWRLPHSLCDAIGYHHQLDGSPCPNITAMCLLSRYFCSVKHLNDATDASSGHLDREAWALLQMDPASLPRLLSVVDQVIEEAQEMFALVRA